MEKKSNTMTFLVTILSVVFIYWATTAWVFPRGVSTPMVHFIWYAGLGVGLIYASFQKYFDLYVNKGFMWAGAVLILIGVARLVPYLNDNLKPLLVGALLIVVIFFGSKYKKELF